MSERIYTPAEIAELLQVSERTARDLFAGEPGVIRLCNSKPGRRLRALIRVPQSVFDRVMEARRNR